MNPGQILIFFNNTGLKLILFFAHLIQFGSPWKMISLASGGSLPVEHIFPAPPPSKSLPMITIITQLKTSSQLLPATQSAELL